MAKSLAELQASVEAKISSDTNFQSEISSLSDEEKTAKIEERKRVEMDNELSSISEKAEKLTKAEEIANNQKIRAEKAEADLKRGGKLEISEGSLSTKDTLALIEAKVVGDDFDEVIRVAKILNKPIPEALKDKTLKSILSERAEERQTALATNTRGGARGAPNVTPEVMLAEADRGFVPDDDRGIEELAKARIEAKKRKK